MSVVSKTTCGLFCVDIKYFSLSSNSLFWERENRKQHCQVGHMQRPQSHYRWKQLETCIDKYTQVQHTDLIAEISGYPVISRPGNQLQPCSRLPNHTLMKKRGEHTATYCLTSHSTIAILSSSSEMNISLWATWARRDWTFTNSRTHWSYRLFVFSQTFPQFKISILWPYMDFWC